jgi:uncharacterized protein YxjI
MASGAFLRTCKRCQHAWTIPAELAVERPSMQGMANQLTSLISGGYSGQVAFQEHVKQIAAAAKCPQCGATSFTQEPVADSAASTPSATSVDPAPSDGSAVAAAPPALPPAPSAPADPSAPSTWVSPSFFQQAAAPQAPVPQASAAPDGQPRTYVLNQQLFSLTGDAWIEDGQGNRAFEVNGQLVSLRGTHVLKDLAGQELYEISKPLAPHIHRTIEIKRGGGTVATVQEAVFHFGGDKFTITNASGQPLSMRGNWGGREFQIADQSGRDLIHVSRVWFSMHNGYGVQIAPDFDVPLGLAIVIALERVEAEERGEKSPMQNLLGGLGQL